MIPLNITIRKNTNISREGWKQAKREAWAEAARFWFDFILPGHFKNSASKRYNYQPRKGEAGNSSPGGFRRSYTGKKLARYGHTKPLVLTGELERVIDRRFDIRVAKSGVGVTLFLHGPKYLHQFRKDHSAPDKAAEITATDKRDRDQLSRLITRVLAEKLNEAGEMKTIAKVRGDRSSLTFAS